MVVVKEMWLLRKGLCEGTEACQRPFLKEQELVKSLMHLYLLYLANMRKNVNTAWRQL
jgi:hypothetical protein